LYNTATDQMNKAQDAGPVNRFPATIADRITIELHEAGNYGTPVATTTANLLQDGTAVAYLPESGSYYLTIKHRNHLETVSALPVDLAQSNAYDFSSSATQAYEDNLVELATGLFGIFAGDVDQNGLLSVLDLVDATDDVRGGVSGYTVTDVDGDGLLTTLDLVLINDNIRAGVISSTPFGSEPEVNGYIIPITINAAYIDEPLTNYTLIFNESIDAALTAVDGPLDSDGIRSSLSSGGDIRFYSDEDMLNRLACDIRIWQPDADPSLARCEFAVKVSSINSSSNTTIYMVWGRDGEISQPAFNEPYGKYATYENTIGHVACGCDGDRAGNLSTSPNVGLTPGDVITPNGFRGTLYEGETSSDYVQMTPSALLNSSMSPTSQWSISAFVRNDNVSSTLPQFIWSKVSASNQYRGLSLNHKEGNIFLSGHSTHLPSAIRIGIELPLTMIEGDWYHILGTYDGTGTGSAFKIYINGVDQTLSATISDEGVFTGWDTADDALIGARNWGFPNSLREWDGAIGTLELLSTNVSAAFAKAKYYNLMQPASLLSFGTISEILE